MPFKKGRELYSRDFNPLHALQFRPIHQSLRITPPMAAGVTGRLWELEDIVRLTDCSYSERILCYRCGQLEEPSGESRIA